MARRGESIYKRKDGRWEARYIDHYEDGKAKYRYLYASTYTEVKEKRTRAMLEARAAMPTKAKQLAKFSEVAYLWLGDMRGTVKEGTFARYSRIAEKYLLPELGGKKVTRMDGRLLTFFIKELSVSGGTDGGGLSSKTVSDIVCVLKAIIRFGSIMGYPFPHTGTLAVPKKQYVPTEILPEESRLLLERRLWAAEDLVSVGILLALYTGMRIGELCGLRWEDIDLEHGTVQIRRTVERIDDPNEGAQSKTKVIVSDPKTEKSYRVIPLPRPLGEHLKPWKRQDSCYLLTGTEKPTEPHAFYLRYKTVLRKCGAGDHSFHALRHTFATRCVEHGFDTKTLAEILGHQSITTTMSLYVHPTMEQKRRQMERLLPGLEGKDAK